MGVISGYNNVDFKPAKFIYSKVRRFLDSFDAANVIDEGEFPTYAKEVLKSLPGAYKECQALLFIADKQVDLPNNFEYLYSAYRCDALSPTFAGTRKHRQESSFAFVTDASYSLIESDGSCEITCCEEKTNLIEKIQVEQYVMEERRSYSFGNIMPLRLSPNLSSLCVEGCPNLFATTCDEITIEGNKIYTSFDDGDCIYMKYYGFPIDDNGDILIPNIEQVEKAIEWYIIYQILLGSWFNSKVPDIQNKWQKAEMEYEKAFAEAKYITKLPSFAEMVNSIRNKRSLNKLVYFSKQYSNTNFTRHR